MPLNDYNAATSLIKAMEDGAQYVRIVAGPRAGSVGRVLSVRSKYYSLHEYNLHIQGRRNFWMKGSELTHLKSWSGGTHLLVNKETPVFNDLMGRPIEVGHVVFFPRSIEGARMDQVIGTVKKIGDKGSIYVKLFKSATDGHDMDGLVRIGKPSSAVVIDKNTVNMVLLAKMTAP